MVFRKLVDVMQDTRTDTDTQTQTHRHRHFMVDGLEAPLTLALSLRL